MLAAAVRKAYQMLLGVVFCRNCILLQFTSNEILSTWILILCYNLICVDITQCYSPNLANDNKEDDEQDFATVRVSSPKKLDELGLQDVPKPGFLGVMHYKQACTITDAS